jgi:hypothetical protein
LSLLGITLSVRDILPSFQPNQQAIGLHLFAPLSLPVAWLPYTLLALIIVPFHCTAQRSGDKGGAQSKLL